MLYQQETNDGRKLLIPIKGGFTEQVHEVNEAELRDDSRARITKLINDTATNRRGILKIRVQLEAG